MSDKYEKNRDYTLRGGKDASIMNNRQKMAEAQHSSKNAFVKGEQAKQARHEGRAPDMNERYMKLDACMSNNGAHAQQFAKSLTAGIDDVAFPVRGDADMSQD